MDAFGSSSTLPQKLVSSACFGSLPLSLTLIELGELEEEVVTFPLASSTVVISGIGAATGDVFGVFLPFFLPQPGDIRLFHFGCAFFLRPPFEMARPSFESEPCRRIAPSGALLAKSGDIRPLLSGCLRLPLLGRGGKEMKSVITLESDGREPLWILKENAKIKHLTHSLAFICYVSVFLCNNRIYIFQNVSQIINIKLIRKDSHSFIMEKHF